jgi:asparagine synthase (glutamine-hydrolysing)
VDTPRLDTVSCYDDSEPNWNEQPYFTKVEQRRGRRGWHIRAEHNGLDAQYDPERFAASPGSRRSGNATKQFLACLASQGNRVVLSGTGGDEVLGGVPTPVPELADLLASGQLSKTKALLGH